MPCRIQQQLKDVTSANDKIKAYQYQSMQIPPKGWVHLTNISISDLAHFLSITAIPLDELELASPLCSELVAEWGNEIHYSFDNKCIKTSKDVMEQSWMLGIWRKP